MERNEQIRKELKSRRIYLYELAAAAGIAEPTLVRWLRTPLTDERYSRLSAGLAKLISAVGGVHNG